MSKKFFIEMQDVFKEMSEYNSNDNVAFCNNRSFSAREMTRSMHIVKAFCKDVPLDKIEFCDFNDGRFIKSVKYSIAFMKSYANRSDYEKFIGWLSYYLAIKKSKFFITDNKNSINLNMI